MDFSKEQQAAITAQNRELLVSAAAGSGKTAVLIEKIYTMLKAEGLSVNRMLVVTFTRAAAAEMRERLKRRMAGDPSIELRKQREQLELAQISTLHSFCHKLVQEYFQAADVDPLSAIADTTVSANLFQEALDTAMDTLYATTATGDAAATALTAKFEDRQIVTMATELYTFLMTLADPFGWLKAQADKRYTLDDLETGAMAETLLADCRVILDGAKELSDALSALTEHPACHPKYIPVIHADIEAAKTLVRSARHGLRAAVTAAQAFALDRMPGLRKLSDEEKDINLEYKRLREALKSLAGKVASLLLHPPDVIIEQLNTMQPALRGLYGLCVSLHEEYMRRKKQRSLLDPNDLEHMALQILSNPDIRAAVATRFDAVFVDEYQDISGVQEALLNSIKRGERAADPPLQTDPLVQNASIQDEPGVERGRGAPFQPWNHESLAELSTAQGKSSETQQAYAIPPDSPTLTTQNSVSQQNEPTIQPSPQPVQAAQDAQKQEGPGVERGRGAPFQPWNHETIAELSATQGKSSETQQAYAIPSNSPTLTKQIAPLEQAEQRFFYVGDVKQSIYRFRQADPTLFMEKEAAFSDDAAAPRRRIDLNRNYRSRSAVITAVNRVFERIMRKDVTEIAYDSRARLYAGQETEGDPPLRLHIFTTPLKAADRVRVQAAAIGQEIVKRVGQPYFDRKENRHRTLRYRDIAILAPRMKGVDEVLTRALQALHIPAYAEGSGAGLQSDEIAQVLCHLKLMDNIQDDLSLLAALRSRAIGMEDAELAEVRIRHKTGSYLEALRETAAGSDALARRCAGALQTIEHERFLMRNMPLHEYLWKWLTRSGLYAFYGCQPYGKLRQANLRLLCEKAVAFQARGAGGIRQFLQSVVSQTSARESVSPTVLGPKEDVVRIMSVHKSKGLEFPVVFLAGLETPMGRQGGADLAMHQTLGVALPYIDELRRVKGPTLLSSAVALRRQSENLAERARVLYVGMTRARDELILMGCMEVPRFASTPPSAYAVANARHMLEWLTLSCDPARDSFCLSDTQSPVQSTSFPHKTGGFCIVSHNSVEETVDFLRINQPEFDPQSVENQRNRLSHLTEEARLLARKLPPAADGADPLLPDITHSHQPFKVGVTALVRARVSTHTELPALADPDLDDPGEMETAQRKRLPLPLTRPRQIADLPALPAFLRETSHGQFGVTRGVAAHKALSLLRYEPLRSLKTERELRQSIQQQLEAFFQKRLFTEEEFTLLDSQALAAFFASEWGHGALTAQTVKREWGFVLALPEEDGMLVQGVIDLCYLQDGQWVLVDYKTDAVRSADALWPLYGAQTALYRRALEELTGRGVRIETLYSLALNQGTSR